jgi:hypothetical protein
MLTNADICMWSRGVLTYACGLGAWKDSDASTVYDERTLKVALHPSSGEMRKKPVLERALFPETWPGTCFTCFTSTKVQILTPEECAEPAALTYAHVF